MTKSEILEQVASGDLGAEEAGELLAKAEEQAFEESIKVGGKGGVVVKVPGQRHPVTLYATDWIYVLERSAKIAQFIKDHKKELSYK